MKPHRSLGPPKQKLGRRQPRRAGDVLGRALGELGVPSTRLSQRVAEAWALVCEPSWRHETRPLRWQGGVLEVGVRSSALRQELRAFHQQRLQEALRAALPNVTLLSLRFVPHVFSPPSEERQ